MARPSRHSAALEYLHARYFGKDPKKLAILTRVHMEMEIARQIYDLRTAAGLTQRQLAARVGTSTSVICRLEDSNYAGHSLSLLRRIAAALSCKVEVRMVPAQNDARGKARVRRRRIA